MNEHSSLEQTPSCRAQGHHGILALLLVLLVSWPADAQRGKRLGKALRELRAQGLELVYSTRLVRPEYRVPTLPEGSLVEQLEQMLAPFGLTTLETSGGALLVVAAASDPEPLSLEGVVFSAHTGAPLSGAAVRIVGFDPIDPEQADSVESRDAPAIGTLATTGPIGQFRFLRLPPGAYELEVDRDDHLPERTTVLAQIAATTKANSLGPPLRIVLLPRAFLNDEIAVRASETSLLKETGASSLSLDRDQVAALPRLGSDVFRALSLLPGVASNDVSAAPRIRGGRRDELQIALDGQEIYGAYHLQDYDNGLSVLAADDLAQVDVIAGNFTAAHGDRMGGVLDLRTRTPDRRIGRLGLSAVSAEASVGDVFADGQGRWTTTARRGSVEFVSALFGVQRPSFWDALGKFEFQLSDRQQVRVHGLVAEDKTEFVKVVATDDGVETDTLDTAYRNDHFWLTHQAVVGERSLVSTSIARSRLRRVRAGSESAEEQSIEIVDNRELSVEELRQRWVVQIAPEHSLEFGGEFRSYSSGFFYQSEFERELSIVGEEIVSSIPPDDFRARFAGDHVGAFVSDRLQVGEAFTLETGLRYDRYSSAILPLGVGNEVWSPRVSLAYELSERTVLRSGWGVYYQSQRPYEIGVEDGQIGPARMERSNQSVLGLEHQFTGERLSGLRVEAYRRRISDPRVRFTNAFEPYNVLQELEPDRIGIDPIRSRTDGLEVVLRGRFGGRVEWWLNYAYSRAEDLLQSEGGGERFVERETDQPQAASFSVALALPRAWQLSVAARYHTGWPISNASLRLVPATEDADETGLLVLGALNSDRLDDYHRLDVRLQRSWDLSRGQLTFFIDVQNLYDRQNASGFDHGIEDGMLEKAPEHWPGIFPSLGVRWSF